MKTRSIRIRVRCWGKAPKRFGVNAYKFSLGDGGILKRNGWTLLGSGRTHDYFALPEGHNRKNLIVLASVPTDDEIEHMALTLHNAGQAVVQEVGGWIVSYRPSSQASSVAIDLFTKERGPAEFFTVNASFTFGLNSSWSICLKWEDGTSSPPRWYRQDENVISDDTLILQNQLSFDEVSDNVMDAAVTLAEGTVQQELIDRYERNSEARRLCIEHYGLSCIICSFNFADRYGPIGQNFIHVHHLIPLSMRGGEYEVDPVRDLIPVCPNCHAMLHRRIPPYSVNELQAMLRQK